MSTTSYLPQHTDSVQLYSTEHDESDEHKINAYHHEDWTTVSDVAVRRKLQNRIAQRKYRQQ
jgi:hypothetical protein